ncbi:MAG: hypothetical protein ABIT05_11070 [Chitinophagaceae bacterium]
MLRYICFLLVMAMPASKGFSHEKTLPPKIITITVNPNGVVYMGVDTLTTDVLATTLHERLWRSYLGNDKMYDSIRVVLNGEVLMGVKGAALDAILQAQQGALKEICLQKYKRLFENIDSRQQKRIRKQFPVLFQKIKW